MTVTKVECEHCGEESHLATFGVVGGGGICEENLGSGHDWEVKND